MPPREAMINREASAARVEYARVGIYGIYVTGVKNRSHARRMSDCTPRIRNFRRRVFGHVPAAERSSKK